MASIAWATKIPTLKIMKNAAIASNMGESLNAYNKNVGLLHSQRDLSPSQQLPAA
jgi:hypothetical protein